LFWIDRSGLGRARRILRDAQKQYRVDVAFARRQGLRGDDLEEAEYNASFDARLAEDAYGYLLTDSLVSQAKHMDIPVPDMSDESDWIDGTVDPSLRLSDEGIVVIRSAIRAHRRESWMFWFQVVSIAIGLLGATAAVLSLMLVLITAGEAGVR